MKPGQLTDYELHAFRRLRERAPEGVQVHIDNIEKALREARRELADLDAAHTAACAGNERMCKAYDTERERREKAEAVIESVQSNLNNVAALHGERLAVPRFQSDEDEHELDKRVEWVIGRWIVAEAAEARAERLAKAVRKYGRHTAECATNHPIVRRSEHVGFDDEHQWRDCNCGWDQTRAALEET